MGIKTRVEVSTADLGINWQKNQTYRIALQQDFVREDGGDLQPNPANSSLFTFTTNATGPVIAHVDPMAGAQLNGYSRVKITYDRKIILGSGLIRLYKAGSPAELISEYNVAETYTNQVYVDTDEKTLVISIDGFLYAANSNYYFTMESSVLKDYDNFFIDAITANNILYFTTGSAPMLLSTTPADNSNTFSGHTLSLTFDRNMVKQSGNITLNRASDDGIVYSWNVNDTTRVKFVGPTVTLDATFYLNPNTAYYINVGPAALRDPSGILFAGISDKTTFNFTTASTIDAGSVSWITGNYTWGGTIYINYPSSTALIPTTENSTTNTKGIKLYSQAGTLLHTFYHGDGLTSTNGYAGSSITINPLSYIQADSYYYFIVEEGAYYDNVTNLTLPGTNDPTRLTFDTNEGIARFDDISYIANDKNNNPFYAGYPTTSPYLKILNNSTSTYTLTLTSTIGKFSDGSSDPVSTLSLTASDSTLGGYLTTIDFYPNYNVTSNGTYTVTLTRNGSVIASETHNLNYASTNNSTEIIRLTTSGTFTPTYDQYTYRPNVTALLVGGGGSGGGNRSGGGGGGFIEQSGITLSNTNYAYNVGFGGQHLSDLTTTVVGSNTIREYQYRSGGNTTMFGLTAYGGLGAWEKNSTLNGEVDALGGTSGAPQSNAGGNNAGYPGIGYGGGGAGETAATADAAGRQSARGLDSTILGSLGGSKLGAGGEDYASPVQTRTYSASNPVDAGHGGQAGQAGTNGIIVIKLSS